VDGPQEPNVGGPAPPSRCWSIDSRSPSPPRC